MGKGTSLSRLASLAWEEAEKGALRDASRRLYFNEIRNMKRLFRIAVHHE